MLRKQQQVAQQLKNMEQNYEKTFMVWGSSIGWLIFYTRLTQDVYCEGYEILGGHVEEATKILQKHNIDRVKFINEDMLQSDIQGVRILVLTSQCWDTSLKEKAYLKICWELNQEALVVDYCNDLSYYENFSMLTVVEGQVSWNHKQQFYIMGKVCNKQ
eukprot:TRINITY_DN8850_c1_g1_i1.p3 TRINITY_DN8850_c1_g1~~TRINITY_DN8850_c1_g1_i1.p3  ORF type:complete len:159 (+),score=16.79 TRINITY_DN8850_c1_g1_i1:202-678(+)